MARRSIVARAPGKIMWIGGYSVMERPNISFATTVDAFVSCEASGRRENRVRLESPQLKASFDGSIDASSGEISGEVPDALRLFKFSAELAARYAAGIGSRVRGFRIKAMNDNAFSYSSGSGKVVKSGLGSSSGITVAAVVSVLKLLGTGIDPDVVNKLAQTAQWLAIGKRASGYDIAAATFGSILYTRYSPDFLASFRAGYTNEELVELVRRGWDYKVEKLCLPEEFELIFASFAGESMSTTKSLGSISEFKEKDPHIYHDLIKELNDENISTVKALKDVKSGGENGLERFKESFDRGRSLTKKLGLLSGVNIEPDDCTRLIEESKKNGAFVAKLPGAGGRDAIAALAMGHEDADRLRKFWSARKELELIDVRVDNQGLR